MSKVQAVIFHKDYYNTTEARKFLKRNRFRPIKRVHKTKNYLRYRITDPRSFDRFITKTIKPGVKFVIGYY